MLNKHGKNLQQCLSPLALVKLIQLRVCSGLHIPGWGNLKQKHTHKAVFPLREHGGYHSVWSSVLAKTSV